MDNLTDHDECASFDSSDCFTDLSQTRTFSSELRTAIKLNKEKIRSNSFQDYEEAKETKRALLVEPNDGQITFGFVFGKKATPILLTDFQMKPGKGFFDDTPSKAEDKLPFEDQLPNFPSLSFQTGNSNPIDRPSKDSFQRVAQCFSPLKAFQPTKIKKTVSQITNLPSRANVKKPIEKPKLIDWSKAYELMANHYMTCRLSELKSPPEQLYGQILVDLTMSPPTLSHFVDICLEKLCFLCKNRMSEPICDKESLFIVSKTTISKLIDRESFQCLYKLIVEKFMRQSTWYPQLLNRKWTVQNFLIEFQKKWKTKCSQQSSFLKRCLQNPKGQSICLCVIKTQQETNRYFVKLSDGWSYAWAVINRQSALWGFRGKLAAGSKILLIGWNIYPLSNVLEFCKGAIKGEQCIEFCYNGSILVQASSKLGKPQFRFYRPIDRCRMDGGLVQVLEGIIIRMYALKEQNSYGVEVLTPEGFAVNILVRMPAQIVPAEWFQLYASYTFLKLRYENAYFLCFGTQSRFIDLQWQKGKPAAIATSFLLSRLVNEANPKIISKRYDILLRTADHQKIIVTDEIKQYPCLLQQFVYEGLAGEYHRFRRCEVSSVAKRLPKIYC